MKKPKMILFAGLWRGGVDLEPDRGRRLEFSKDEFLHGEVPRKGGLFQVALLDRSPKPLALAERSLVVTGGSRRKPVLR